MKPEIAFGIILKQLRKKAGLSQETLSNACGLDRTYISMLERGKRQPTLTVILKIAKTLGVSGTYFLKSIEELFNENNKN